MLNNFYFYVKMIVGFRANGFLCEKDGRADGISFSEAKGGFALLRPPRGPPELVCPFGANEQEARPWVLDEKLSSHETFEGLASLTRWFLYY
jgi:hypothetical protein